MSDNARLTLRAAQAEDAALIASLRRDIWATTYRGIYPDEMIDNFDLAWHTEKDAARIRSDAYDVYLLLFGGEPVGYLTLQRTRPVRLLSLYLLHEYQGRGIGGQAFDFIRAYCREHGTKTFTCTCQPDNAPAMRFYQRRGGEIIARDMDSAEPWQNSVTYRFSVPQPPQP